VPSSFFLSLTDSQACLDCLDFFGEFYYFFESYVPSGEECDALVVFAVLFFELSDFVCEAGVFEFGYHGAEEAFDSCGEVAGYWDVYFGLGVFAFGSCFFCELVGLFYFFFDGCEVGFHCVV